MALSVLRADSSVMMQHGTPPPTLIEAAALFCAEYTVPWQVLLDVYDISCKLSIDTSLL
jgi:hypothetical protein